MIIYKSFHNIDVSSGSLKRKNMPEDFDSFVNSYIAFANRNGNNKEYNIPDVNSTVVHCISQIAAIAIPGNPLSEEESLELNSLANSIATKLLTEEQRAQQRIFAMGKQIKLGSLIQALIKMYDGEYRYIIAKVEHSEWYDGESLRKNLGFPSEKKNVWKSAVFHLVVDEDISFDSVRVYTDNDAKYWAEQFLELSEKRNDQTNTVNAMEAIDVELKRRVMKASRRDFYNIRNTLIQTLKSPQVIHYEDLVEILIGRYQPDEPSLKMEELKAVLLALPEKKNFDRQFNTVPDAIKKRRKLRFPVTGAIELTVEEGVGNYRDSIRAIDSAGKKYLQIECHNPDTYNLFSPAYHEAEVTDNV